DLGNYVPVLVERDSADRRLDVLDLGHRRSDLLAVGLVAPVAVDRRRDGLKDRLAGRVGGDGVAAVVRWVGVGLLEGVDRRLRLGGVTCVDRGDGAVHVGGVVAGVVQTLRGHN